MYTQLLCSFTAPFSLLISSFSHYSYIINILFIFAGGVGWYEARFLNEPFFGAHYKVDVLPTQMYFCNRTDRRSVTRVWPGLTTKNGMASCGSLNSSLGVCERAPWSRVLVQLNKHIKTWRSVGLNFELVSPDAVLLMFKRDFLYSFSVAVQFVLPEL